MTPRLSVIAAAIRKVLSGGTGGGTGPTGDPYFDKVSMLLHFEGTDGDTTTTDVKGHTLTLNGGLNIASANKKFGNTSAYMGSVGSSYRYITTPSSPAFIFGTGDFTVEAWVYLTGYSAEWGTFLFDTESSGDTATSVKIVFSTSGKLVTTLTPDGTTTITTGAWHHIALSRKNGVAYSFLDGHLEASSANTTNLTCAGPLYIGMSHNAASTTNIQGYLDELRVTKGVGRYTNGFSVPTAPFLDMGMPATNDPYLSDVYLLMHFDSSTTFDVMGKAVTANGTITLNTSTKQFGAGSASINPTIFAGNGTAYFSISSFPALVDYTIEFSIYPLAYQGFVARADGGGDYLNAWFDGTNLYAFSISASAVNASANIPLNAWSQIALVRSGSTGFIFVNGVVKWTGTVGTGSAMCNLELFGAHDLTCFAGYLDELRITAVARYLTNYTPATAPFFDN